MFKLSFVRRGSTTPYKTMDFKDKGAAMRYLSDGGYFYGSISTEDWKDTGPDSAVFTNSALNAKFKVGDRVVSRILGREGTVVKVHEDGHVDVRYGSDMGNVVQERVVDKFFKALNARFKVGDRVNVGGHTVTIVKILGKTASGEQLYGVKQDDNGWTYELLEGKIKAKTFNPANSVVANALAATAKNAQHFHGEADALAQKIALQYNKWIDAPDGRKGGEFDKLNALIRTASSLGGGVWVMRDGTIAIAQNQPRGAKRIAEFL